LRNSTNASIEPGIRQGVAAHHLFACGALEDALHRELQLLAGERWRHWRVATGMSLYCFDAGARTSYPLRISAAS